MSYLLAYNPYNTNLFMRSRSIDPSAAAYFTATGITGATQQTAIDNLVKGLKADGLWTKMKAVYPFVTDNRNLLSYTEQFGDAYWGKLNSTVTSNSITAPDGTLTADTFTGSSATSYIYTNTPISSIGNNTFSIYVKAGSLTSFSLDFATSALSYGGRSIINLTTGTAGAIAYYGGASGWTTNVESVGNGWYRCSIGGNIATTQNMYCEIMTNIGNLFIWGAQLELNSTATNYQPIATTQQAFISSQFKYNLVNPVDSDAAFRLVFNGGWTHSSNGATPNGTNGYADTFVNPFLHTLGYSQHVSMYSRTQNTSISGVQLGVLDSASAEIALFQYYNSVSLKGATFYAYPARAVKINNTNTLGFQIASRTSNNSLKLYFNNSLLDTNTNTETLTRPNGKIYLGGSNWFSTGATQYTPHQHAFDTIGDGLTDTEAANLYTRVQAFQTSLSRNI